MEECTLNTVLCPHFHHCEIFPFCCCTPLKMFRSVIMCCLLLFSPLFLHPIDAAGYTSLSQVLDYTKMFCRGDLPKRKFGLFTMNWSMSNKQWSNMNFRSLAHLCTAHGNPKGNLGGVVRKSHLKVVHSC